ncbi:MAG: (d)CMP kinase, partial [Anaerolineales bacterium]|nr:(d)CMP kinase [Anaerolineales bacterium]
MSSTPTVIAIDGPASSGKSTLGQFLAEKLDYLYFDTGCLYRAVTVAALQRGLAPTDAAAVAALAAALDIRVKSPDENDGRQYTVLVDELDVTWELRSPQTDAHVSTISAFAEVRRTLTERMRAIARA